MSPVTLLHLTFVGPGKEPATVDFGPKLTVIYGASNTGKSFIVDAIDYMLGAGKLKEIEEAEGYTRILLGLRLPDGKVITLSRAPETNKIDVFAGEVRELTAQAPIDTLSTVHNAESDRNISRYLLKAIGADGQRVRVNANGKLRTLSLRDLAHLCVINETQMAAPRSPVLTSGQHTKATAEKSVFRFLMTAEGEAEGQAGTTDVEKQVSKGKVDLLTRLINDAETSLTMEGNEAQLREQLARLESSLAETSAAVGELVAQRSRLIERNHALEAQKTDNRRRTNEVQVLVARFGLLRQQYESDLARLQMVAEAGNLLGYFRAGACVFCGAEPEHQQPGHHLAETSQLQAAVIAETRKTNELHADLLTTIEDLEEQLATLDTECAGIRNTADGFDHKLAELDERLTPHNSDMQDLIAVRSQINAELATHAQIQRLKDIKADLSSTSPTPPPARSEGIPASDLVDFEKLIQKALLAWKVRGENHANYDESTAEIAVDARKRAGHGKGMRSIIHAAFTTALARYCVDRNIPHLGFVVLDSPVLTYRQPEDDTNDVILTEDVVEHFYRDLAQTFPRQVIVIENKTPPADIGNYARVYPFSVPGSQRAGFFPPVQNDT